MLRAVFAVATEPAGHHGTGRPPPWNSEPGVAWVLWEVCHPASGADAAGYRQFFAESRPKLTTNAISDFAGNAQQKRAFSNSTRPRPDSTRPLVLNWRLDALNSPLHLGQPGAQRLIGGRGFGVRLQRRLHAQVHEHPKIVYRRLGSE